jgi:hypothetical protein
MNSKTGFILLMICCLFAEVGYGQLYKISGRVTDSKKEPLALVSLEIKELRKGIVTRDDGSYEFFLERGRYDLVISIIGYKTKVFTFYINNEDIVEDIILEPEAEDLSEVVIKAKLRDRAEEYIRNVIRNKGIILDAIGSYSCKIYVRAFQLDSGFTKKKKEEDSIATEDFNNMFMTEVSLHLDKSSGGQTKEERLGVNKRGKTESLFYLSATDGDFYLYDNLIHAPPVSKIPFVSPLSYSGLLAYRFKTLKIDRTKKPREYTVAIRPRQLSNATIEGEIVIQDSTWAVLSTTFRLPPAHMPEYDFMEIKQVYSKVGDSARMITRQQFNYYIKTKKGRLHGETIAVYSGYELHKNFRRGYFGTEVSSTTKEAYEKDSSFWKSVRTEPLSRQQELYTRYQDSIYKLMRSEAYLDSIDRVLNKVTWKKMLIFGQLFNDHKKERMWILPPLTTIFQPIQFGGTRIRLEAAFRKTYPSRKDIYVQAQLSYGFRNGDINGRIDLKRKYNPFNRGKFNLSAGRDFAFIFEGDAWVNMLKRSNIYLNNYFETGHELELLNGLWLSNQFEIAFRRSVSKYITNPKADSLFGGLLANDRPVEFEPYNAFYSEIKLYFTPKQPYIREPKEKIFLPAKWPTFYVKWRKGVPGIFRSEIDFDFFEYGIEQKINFGVMGVTSYTIKTGNTPNKKNLRIVDYQFQRRGDPLLFLNPNRAFQSLDSTFALFERFYQGNLVHEFNGALVNRIPFFKKLKIQEMAGAGFLVAQERNLVYTELFAGLERVFKWPPNPLSRFKLGVYVVSSFANTFRNPIQFKIGITTWDRFKNRWR